jgi:Uma2 family endonuclease
MSVTAPITTPDAFEPLYRLAPEQYHAMTRAGILGPADPIDFHNGILLIKDPPSPTDELFRLTVQQYHQMIDSGILPDDEPVELLEGLLVRKMSKKPLHETVIAVLNDLLPTILPTGWCRRIQAPVTLANGEPEPDVSIARGTLRDYLHQHPTPESIALVIEVAESSLARDRGPKRRSYARAGIETYWIVNLESRTIELFDLPDPTTSTYKRTTPYDTAAAIPLTLSGQVVAHIPVKDILL